MKYIRLFPSASIRDAVLAEIEHGVLSYTEGEGMLLKAVAAPPHLIIQNRFTLMFVDQLHLLQRQVSR